LAAPAWWKIPEMQKIVAYICENGYEHHAGREFFEVALRFTKPPTITLAWKLT